MTLDLIWAPFAGALVGFIVGLTGVGGGALMAPILLLGFGVELQTVVATDLLFATITKLACWRHAHPQSVGRLADRQAPMGLEAYDRHDYSRRF